MSDAAEKLKPLLESLTADERAEVIEYIHELGNSSAEDEEMQLTEEEWEAEWADECNRRLARMKSGESVGIPHAEVMRQMKEKFG